MKPNLPEIILHIGDGKCGSTAIQSSLNSARNKLEEYGILYYPIKRNGGHFEYYRLLGKKLRTGNDSAKEKATNNLSEQASIINNGHINYVVISAEPFFMLAKPLIAKLIELLSPLGSRIHVLAYLRYPENLFISRVQQVIKADHRIPTPESYKRDFTQPFRHWASMEECVSLTANLLEPDRLIGGSVVSDFAAQLSAITGQELIGLPDRRENPSLSSEQMIVLQDFRRRFCEAEAGRFIPRSNAVLTLFNEINSEFGRVGSKPLLRPDYADLIRARHAEIMLAIHRMFPWMELERLYSNLPVRQRTPPATTSKVAELVTDHDEAIEESLRNLIIEYRYDAAPVDQALLLSKAAKTIGVDEEGLLPIYRAYLERCGVKHSLA